MVRVFRRVVESIVVVEANRALRQYRDVHTVTVRHFVRDFLWLEVLEGSVGQHLYPSSTGLFTVNCEDQRMLRTSQKY